MNIAELYEKGEGGSSRICRQGDGWAHEKNNPFVLACAAVGHRIEQKKTKKKDED